ncbi:MAG: hypothetical protein JWM12_431 [Ilumatobacteraceae bacterium]|nr:hypothetical protein [Ilumatobacteraceae bacterium]
MAELVETRWRRYGKDRVYLKTRDGSDVGYVDLVSGTVVAQASEWEPELRDCLRRWSTTIEQPLAASNTESTSPDHQDPAPELTERTGLSLDVNNDLDLAATVAGAAARAKRNEVNARAPVVNLVARVLGVKTEERNWRVGAHGEEQVGRELAKLDTEWRVLHSVEVGDNGSDIDHVVIGPPGVLTLNVKHHPRGKAWIAERVVMVNGHKTDYLRNSRFEARRSMQLLSAASGQPVAVAAAIVFVGLDELTIKQMPEEIHITTKRRLLAWLRSLPVTTSQSQVDDLHALARRRATWTQSTNPSR